MKKIILVALAAFMAIGFSAFSPASETATETLYYKVFNGTSFDWYPIQADRCEPGEDPCEVQTVNHGIRQLHDAINGNPLTKL